MEEYIQLCRFKTNKLQKIKIKIEQPIRTGEVKYLQKVKPENITEKRGGSSNCPSIVFLDLNYD